MCVSKRHVCELGERETRDMCVSYERNKRHVCELGERETRDMCVS